MTGGIEDITPHVEIEGGEEAKSTIADIGQTGVDSFEKMAEAAESVAEPVGAIEAAARRAGISYEEMAERARAAGEAASSGAAAAGQAVDQHTEKVKQSAAALKELGVIGAEAFAKILEKAAGGDFTGLMTLAFGKLAGAITEVVQYAAEFVEQSARMVETLDALSTATGMTVPELIGLKDAFASVGISATSFERAVGRLAITIANDWASIEQNVRTSADRQTGAMLHMQQATLNTQKAYQNLDNVLDNMSQTARKDALGIESAALSLQRAQQALNDAAFQSKVNSNSVEGAELALRRARMDNDKLEGHTDYKENEKALKIDESRFKIKQLETNLEAANRTKAGEPLKRMQDELALREAAEALRDIQKKRIRDEIKDQEELKQAHLNIAKERLAQSEAAERQHQVDLKDIPKIARELKDVQDGYKKWDEVTNHAEITTKTFTEALLKNAAAGKAGPPTAKEALDELAKIMPKLGDSADANEKKIAIMQHAMGAGFRAGQASAAQMMAVFERGKPFLDGLKKSAEDLEEQLKFKTIESNLKAFQGAYTSMNTIVDVFKAKLSSIMSVPLTDYFDMIAESLKKPDGNLNKLVISALTLIEAITKLGTEIVKALGTAASPIFDQLIRLVSGLFNVLAKVIDAVRVIGEGFAKLTGLGENIGGLTTLVTGLSLAFAGVLRNLILILGRIALLPLGIGALVTATGLLVEGWSKLPSWMGGGKETSEVGEKIQQAGQGISRAGGAALGFTPEMMNNLPGVYGKEDKGEAEARKKAAESLEQAAQEAKNAAGQQSRAGDKLDHAGAVTDGGASKLTDAANSISNNASYAAEKLKDAASALKDAATSIIQSLGKGSGKAGGGKIRGPGGPTDDAAGLYALSDGEYVVKSAAVSHYGTGIFDALNDMAVGGFAFGGQVGSITPPRASEAIQTAPTSILNLSIDGQHFNGLTAPEHVATKLKNYAVIRQTTAAGRRPSWAA